MLRAPTKAPSALTSDAEVEVPWNGEWLEASDRLSEYDAGGAEEVAEGLPMPVDLSSDGTTLYWTTTSEGAVWQMPEDGRWPQPWITGVTNPRQAVRWQEHLYWVQPANDGAIFRASLDGGTVTVLAAHQASAMGLAVNDAGLYWSLNDDGKVMFLAHGEAEPRVVASGQDHPRDVLTDGESIYWLDYGSPEGDGWKGGGIHALRAREGADALLASAPGPWQLGLHAGRLYWFAEKCIQSMTVRGGEPRRLMMLGNGEHARSLAFSGDFLFAATDTALWSYSLKSGAKVQLAAAGPVGGIDYVAATRHYVFWSDMSRGRIWRQKRAEEETPDGGP
jgi:hypothetical protein